MYYNTAVTNMFRPSCGHLQGGENENSNIIKMCLNYSTALKIMDSWPLKRWFVIRTGGRWHSSHS